MGSSPDAGFAEALMQPRQVLAVRTVSQHQLDQAFGELQGGDAGQHLDVGEFVCDVGRARDEANLQTA